MKFIEDFKKDYKEDPALTFCLSAIHFACIVGIMFIGLLVFSAATKSDDVIKTTTYDYGKITSVSHCKASKRSTRCLIKTTKGHSMTLRVTDFPGDDMLYVGDHIFTENKIYNDRVETYRGRNGYIRSNSVCHSWMPCYDNYDN